MERLRELKEKFPELPWTIIVQTDVEREGIKYTPVLNEIGQWALPKGGFFQNLEHKKSLHTADKATGGWLVCPENFMFSDGTAVIMGLSEDSPYEIRYEGEGCYMLYRDEEPVDEVRFYPRPEWYSKKTSDGRFMSTVMCQMADCYFMFYPLAYCEYGRTGDSCGYCGLNAYLEMLKSLGMERPPAATPKQITETVRTAVEEMRAKQTNYMDNKVPCGQDNCRCLRMTMLAGSMTDLKKEVDFYARMVKAVLDGCRDIEIHVASQAFDREGTERMRELGVHSVSYDLEVWDEKLFEIVCPGKAKYVGRNRWIDNLLAATDIFPGGHVSSFFVTGVEMAQPFGFKTIDEALESTLGGFEWLCKHGIAPVTTVWTRVPGSRLAHCEAPPTEYYLKVGLEYHKLMMKYNLYAGTSQASCYRGGCPTGVWYRWRWPDTRLTRSLSKA